MRSISAPVRAIGTAIWLLWRALRSVIIRSGRGDAFLPGALATGLARFLWRPLPTIGTLSALTGLISGILATRLLGVYNVETLVIGSVAETVVRQVLPLVIGVFAAGSIAVDLATRLGAMGLAAEIEALEGMGRDAAGFVLGPFAVAVLASSPLHMTLAALVALLAAGIPVTLGAYLSWFEFGQIVLTDRVGTALLAGVAKAFVFSLLAFLVGSTVGVQPPRTSADIARQGSRAFTVGLLLIFAMAALWVAFE